MWLSTITYLLAILVVTLTVVKRMFLLNLQMRENMDAALAADILVKNTHYAGACYRTDSSGAWAFVAREDELKLNPTLVRMRMGVFDPPIKSQALMHDCYIPKNPNINVLQLTNPNAYPSDMAPNVQPETRALYDKSVFFQDQFHLFVACVYVLEAIWRMCVAIVTLLNGKKGATTVPKKQNAPPPTGPVTHTTKEDDDDDFNQAPPPFTSFTEESRSKPDKYAATPNLNALDI
jgi:hypothetical protein